MVSKTVYLAVMLIGLLAAAVNGQRSGSRTAYSEYEHDSGEPAYGQFDEFEFGPQARRQARRIVADKTPLKGRQFHFDPEEFRNFESEEETDDGRSYTVGARINVQHPAPARKYKDGKSDESHATSFTNFRISHDEILPSVTKHQYTKSKPHAAKKPLFKPFYDSESESVEDEPSQAPSFGFDKPPSDFKPDFTLKKVPNLYPRDYSNVASKKQIAKYIEDQQKLLDDAIQSELLNDPNPSARGKYQQFLKAKDDERIEKEYEEELKRKPVVLFKPNHSPKRRQPRKHQQRRPKVVNPPQQRGLGGFRNSVPQPMTFSLDV